ncbi:MAG: hypothetical protein HC836_22250 [Richelia sp. RM2_1_2]|nr:hypothetical protein [Richelia sp. RM2_1_2]
MRSFNILERASIFRPQETIQRQDTASLPEIPNYQLTTPSLLQPPEPSSRYSLGVDSQLELDPEILAMAELLIQQQMELAAVRAALSQVNLLPSLPGLESTAPNPFSLPPTPQSPPLVPPGEGPDTPRSGTTGDLISAVLAIPTIDSAIASLQTQALAQLSGNWRQLSTPEQALVSSVVVIASSALAGVLTNPSAREFALSQLNGRVIPVPGLDWLHLELNTESDNLMMGLHVDVGSLLPSSLGFGSSSTEPIGAPPSPEPFVPGQSVQRKELVEPRVSKNYRHYLGLFSVK